MRKLEIKSCIWVLRLGMQQIVHGHWWLFFCKEGGYLVRNLVVFFQGWHRVVFRSISATTYVSKPLFFQQYHKKVIFYAYLTKNAYKWLLIIFDNILLNCMLIDLTDVLSYLSDKNVHIVVLRSHCTQVQRHRKA